MNGITVKTELLQGLHKRNNQINGYKNINFMFITWQDELYLDGPSLLVFFCNDYTLHTFMITICIVYVKLSTIFMIESWVLGHRLYILELLHSLYDKKNYTIFSEIL